MTTDSESLLSWPGTQGGAARRLILALAWAAILALTVFFLGYYAAHYYFDYTPASYDPYWPRRGWLLLHVSGGMLALVMGPWQFWTGLRRQVPRIHRWTGRLFLIGVATGVTGAAYLAVTTTFGWAWGIGIGGLAAAWATTAAVALYAIRRGDISAHKRWMIRTYVVTFAFVTDRILDYWLPGTPEPDGDRIVTDIWASWVVPLFATIVIQSLVAMRPGMLSPAEDTP
jgi:uncharacterized membrane protein